MPLRVSWSYFMTSRDTSSNTKKNNMVLLWKITRVAQITLKSRDKVFLVDFNLIELNWANEPALSRDLGVIWETLKHITKYRHISWNVTMLYWKIFDDFILTVTIQMSSSIIKKKYQNSFNLTWWHEMTCHGVVKLIQRGGPHNIYDNTFKQLYTIDLIKNKNITITRFSLHFL